MKHLNRLFTLLALSVATLGSYAQQTVGTPEELDRFSKSTIYVVLENNPMLKYNLEIRKTVEKHWTLTPFEFVTFTSEEFEKARLDPNKSFLMVNTLQYDRDKVQAKYDYLCVQLGGNYKMVRQMPDIAQVPIAYNGVEEEVYAYKLGMLCLFLQNHIKVTKENPKLNSKNIVKYYNAQRAEIHDKTLYVLESDLTPEINTEAKIKAIYPYKVKIATRDEIKAAIDARDESVVFLHKIGPEGSKRKARCYNAIVGAADARLYYFSWHMINDSKKEGLLAKDLKKLAKAKKK